MKKEVSFKYVVQFIYEEKNVIYVDFDWGFTFYTEAPTKIEQINRERKDSSRSREKPKWIPKNDQHTCCIEEKHASYIFQFFGTRIQQLL